MTLLPLQDAVQKISAKTPIGSLLRSADWARVPLALRERAQFSAGVTSARLLQSIQDRLQSQIKLEREKLANGKDATFDRSSFIDSIRDIARDEGLDRGGDVSSPGKGTLTDITSIPRLGLIYDMQNQQAAGYARWKMDQSEGALLLYPAWEFLRVEDRRVPRDSVTPGFWDRRWLEAANAAGDDDAARIFSDTGRKVALKTSGLWSKLSIFGTPWMPFDWGSGMGVEDIDRETAIQLGLLEQDELPEPTGEKNFNDELQASVRNVDPELQEFLKESFGDQVKFEGDAVWWKGDRQGKRLAVGVKPKTIPVPVPEEPEPADKPEGEFPESVRGLTRVKELGGSTGAALMKDSRGRLFVMKRGNSAGHVREEFLADELYRAAGAKVPAAKLYTDSAGNPVKLAQYIEGKTLDQWLKSATAADKAAMLEQLQQHFHIDALMANWDVAGLGLDNILVDNAGVAWRIDNGGSLRYRAQGGLKTSQEWSQHPIELWTLRDPQSNPKTAELFGGVDFYHIAERIRSTDFSKLVQLAPEDVRETLQKRVQNIVDTSRKALEYKEARFVPQHADRVTEEIMRIRQAGIPDILAERLNQEPGDPVTLKDPSGRRFNHLRSVTKVGQPAAKDPSEQYYDVILQAVKTINAHHAKGDTNYNAAKLENAVAQKAALGKLLSTGSPAEQAMAAKYLETLAELEAAKGKKDVMVKQFSQASKVGTQPEPAAARSAIDALADHMRQRGGDWALVESWAAKQAGSSSSQESRVLKRWLFERLQGVKASEFHALPKADILSSLSGAERLKYDRTFETFHGFVQEVLGKMDFSANDRAARVVRVLRSETSRKAVPFSPGESGIYKRGVNESGSLYTQFSSSGANTETVVPHSRITSIYFLEQKPGSGLTFLLGDSENEVTYMAHGLTTRNVSGHTPKENPGTDSTKWETRW